MNLVEAIKSVGEVLHVSESYWEYNEYSIW